MGLPVLALLREADQPEIDFSGGHVELSFAPSNAAETLARIELVLARARGPKNKNLITHGDLVIDQDRYEVRLNGRPIDLTYKEYELLKYISARPGRVFSRDALLRAVWDYDYFGGTRTVERLFPGEAASSRRDERSSVATYVSQSHRYVRRRGLPREQAFDRGAYLVPRIC